MNLSCLQLKIQPIQGRISLWEEEDHHAKFVVSFSPSVTSERQGTDPHQILFLVKKYKYKSGIKGYLAIIQSKLYSNPIKWGTIQVVEAEYYVIWTTTLVISSKSFTQEIFTESLLCARHWGYNDKQGKVTVLMKFIFRSENTSKWTLKSKQTKEQKILSATKDLK